MSKLILEIEVNAEGHKLAYLSRDGDHCSMRIAGPKAWGGSKNIAKLEISDEDIVRFIREHAPEIIPKLSACPPLHHQ